MDNPMDTNTIDNEMATPTRSRKGVYIILGVVLVLVLAGAAFMAGKLMNQPSTESSPQMVQGEGGGPGFSVSGPGGEGEVMVGGNVIPAPELPSSTPDANGLFVKLEDNSLFIGTGKLTMGVMVEGGETKSESSYDGPVLEVVVTNETKIYLETTQLDPSNPPKPDEEIQQTVKLSTLDEISKDSTIVVWGRRTGDRMIADVILYTQPMIFNAAPPP